MYKLDKYQISAVQSEEKNSLVVAAPGSGKTTVIINRVDYLVSNLKIPNGNIVVITFTKAAATNMKERYISTFKRNSAPFFGTFHGLFYKILIRDGRNIDIIDSKTTYKIVSSVLSKYFDEVNDDKVKEVINNISLYKTSILNPERFKPSISNDIFDEAFEKYEAYKKENKKMDFDDLVIEVLELLKNNEGILEGYRKLFRYILVDEFQDCDELQIAFLKMMNKDDNSLFAVGDEDQCIYSFRGSMPEYMVSFNENFDNAKKYYLAINYRSKRNIVNLSKNLISFNKERNEKDINYFRDEEGIVKWYNPYNEKIEAETIVDIIKKNRNLDIPYEKNAILYRTNMESINMIDALTKNKIPFTLLDKEYNFFENFICKDIMSYLKLAINQFDRESFIRIINKPFRYVSKANLSYVQNYYKSDSPFDILIEKDDIPPFQKKKLSDLRKDINYLNKISVSSAVAYIIMDLEYIDYLNKYAERLNQSIDDFEDILEEFKLAVEDHKSIMEFLNHVEEVKKTIIEQRKKEKNREGVILSTIHGVKGMEFKNVFLINCSEDTIPHSSGKDDNLEEERRIFYVGMTRAIDELYLFSPRNRKGQFKDVSRFIVEGEINDLPIDTYGFEIGNKIIHRTYGQGVVQDLEKDKITIRFSDGIERSFSLKILVENNLIDKI